MPRLDIYHDVVKSALTKDGWVITHDPLVLHVGIKQLFVDIGASRLISAEKGSVKIAVEIKSFLGPSSMRDLEQALGQYILYQTILNRQHVDRILYIAIIEEVFKSIFISDLGEMLLTDQNIHLLVFDDELEVIIQWIPEPSINA